MADYTTLLARLDLLRKEGESFTYQNFATYGSSHYPIAFTGPFSAWCTRLDNIIRASFLQGSGVIQRVATGLAIHVLGNGEDKFDDMMAELLGTIDEAKRVLVNDKFGEVAVRGDTDQQTARPNPSASGQSLQNDRDGGRLAVIYGQRWEVLRRLGEGGQAQTFIVKDLHSQSDAEFVLKEFRQIARAPRFKTEVEALEKVKHGNVVVLVDHDLSEAQPNIVMEYCRGGNLEDARVRLGDDPVTLLKMMAEVCDGVGAAHARSIVHRDIKPANILLRTELNGIVVGDFGIAFIADGERHTLTNEAVGARRFTAPELADGRAEDVGPRSDVYSIGKLVYWALAGGRVFDREQHRSQSNDLARRDGGNPQLEHVNRILDKMIAHNPADRFADATIAGGAVREVAKMLESNSRVLANDLRQACVFCGVGEYVEVDLRDSDRLFNFGLSTPPGGGEWHVLACSNCGNLQVFRPDRTKLRKWWGPQPGDPYHL